MMKIWNSLEMVTVLERTNRQGVINFAETILGEEIVQHGPAGKSKFNKALEVLADHDFEVYKNLTHELLKVNK